MDGVERYPLPLLIYGPKASCISIRADSYGVRKAIQKLKNENKAFEDVFPHNRQVQDVDPGTYRTGLMLSSFIMSYDING
jgi:hypothetical protein